jgi:hypothetical protein
MKELFTKTFWQGVKHTFDEALEGQATKHSSSRSETEDQESSKPATSPSDSAKTNQS